MSAIVVEKAGFEAVALQSFQCAVRDGVPDNGMITPHETLDTIRKIARAISIPIIVDFEQGYGDAYTAVYWMREFEKAGAAALHIDDYDYIYRCPFIPPYLPTLRCDKDVVAQLEAMAAERYNKDTLLIARSGAALCRAFGEATQRAAEANRRSVLFWKAGADVIFTHVLNKEHLISLREVVKCPILLQQAVLGREPEQAGPGGVQYAAGLLEVSVDELYQLGVRIVTDPTTLQGVALKAMQEAAFTQKRERRVSAVRSQTLSLEEMEKAFMDVDGIARVLTPSGGGQPTGAASPSA